MGLGKFDGPSRWPVLDESPDSADAGNAEEPGLSLGEHSVGSASVFLKEIGEDGEPACIEGAFRQRSLMVEASARLVTWLVSHEGSAFGP